MLLFYVDECGDAKPWSAEPQASNDSSAYFVLAAVGVRDTSRELLAEYLQHLRAKHVRLPGGAPAPQWEGAEIKGRYVAQAARAAAKGVKPARAVYRDAFSGVAPGRGLMTSLRNAFNHFRPTIFVVVIDKQRLAEQGNTVEPLGAAYAILHQRVASTLEKIVGGEGALFVADQQVEHEAYFKDGRMNAAREVMAGHLKAKPQFNRVLDKALWIDTDHSEWDREIIQLADIAAYASYELAKLGHAPEEDFYMWSAIEPWLARHWGSGKAAGAGLSIYPAPKRYPNVGVD